MEFINQADFFRSTFFVLTLTLSLFILGVFGLRKIRRMFKHDMLTGGTMDSGQIPGANKDMSFVFDTFQKTLQEITCKKRELIQMHKEAEERIRQMERHNECILESMVSGVVAFDRQGQLTSMNQAAARILDWNRDQDPMGMIFDELLQGSDQMKEILEKVLHEGRGILREEITFTMKDGERRWLGVNASPLRGDSSEMIGTTLLFTDLTEVKELQKQVELKNRLAAMGEMSAGIAHEFRNSLGAILGYARLVERQAGDNEILNESADGIMSEVKNFDAMLSDFLCFARPHELNKEECLLDVLVGEALEVLSEEVAQRGAKVAVQSDGLPTVQADRTMVRQALTNLIKNALQATGEGGEIQISEKKLSDRVELWIQDDGPGISKENQKKIFEPFFTTKSDGTGLGLAITQKTILSHQGSLRIHSGEGKGTVVIVTLPLQNSAA